MRQVLLLNILFESISAMIAIGQEISIVIIQIEANFAAIDVFDLSRAFKGFEIPEIIIYSWNSFKFSAITDRYFELCSVIYQDPIDVQCSNIE